MSRTLFVLATAAALVTGCERAGHDTAVAATKANAPAEDQAVRAHMNRYLELLKNRDANAIAMFFTDDGVVMPPGQPPAQGRDAVRQFWQSTAKSSDVAVSFQPEETQVSGDFAVDRGNYRLKGKVNGKPVEQIGKYVVIWKKVGDDWKVATDIWNTDRAAAL